MQRSFGITTIYVTHDQREAAYLAHWVASMRAGRIETREKTRMRDGRFLRGDRTCAKVARSLFTVALVIVSASKMPCQQSSPTAVATSALPSPSLFTTQATPGPSPATRESTAQAMNPLTLDEALRLAATQSSAYQQAALSEGIAAEDVKQAQAAFLPRVSAPLSYLYTSPAFGLPPGEPRVPSFIANNAASEYQAYLNVAGDIDIVGKFRATLRKNRALLAAAHAGTEVARRALAQAVVEAYYGLALAYAQRHGAEQNLAAAEEFVRITSLLLSGGEVAPVDLTRAQLQTTTRSDELEKARANEEIAAGSLRVLVGYDFLQPIATT